MIVLKNLEKLVQLWSDFCIAISLIVRLLALFYVVIKLHFKTFTSMNCLSFNGTLKNLW